MSDARQPAAGDGPARPPRSGGLGKIALVAQRELLENVRTKTFWIGILAFPVIIALSFGVGRLMHEAKEVRLYAVLDKSPGQWLSEEVYRRAQQADLQRILKEVQEDLGAEAKANGEAPALPANPQERLGRVRQKLADRVGEDHALVELLDILSRKPELLERMQEAKSPLAAGLSLVRDPDLAAWMQSLAADPRRLAQISGDLDAKRYRRMTFDDLGPDPEKALQQKLERGELFAYFVINEDPAASDEGSKYFARNWTDTELKNWFERHATEAVREKRVARLRLTAEQAGSLLARFDFEDSQIDPKTGAVQRVKSEQKAFQWAPVAFVYLLWIAVFTAAQLLLTNTVEEKSNRIIEVLLSSVSPFQLMAGKIFGIAATGLTIVGSWVLFALLAFRLLPAAMPGIDQLGLSEIIGDPRYLASFVGYFLGGYLLYAAILVAIGSVCNSLKEAQHLMQPVFILLIVPLIAMVPVVNDPNGPLARILTWVPLFTPFVMMNRAGGPPPAWEYVATSVLILVTVVVAFWAAGKIFRIGVLMTGKPPRVREILRWLRASPGAVPAKQSPVVTDAAR